MFHLQTASCSTFLQFEIVLPLSRSFQVFHLFLLMDRGISKLLALPFFDEEFRRLVDVLAFHTVERIICVQAPCGPAFAQKVMELAPALVRCAPDGSPDLNELEAVAARFDQFDLSGTWFQKRRICCSYRRLGCWALVPLVAVSRLVL